MLDIRPLGRLAADWHCFTKEGMLLQPTERHWLDTRILIPCHQVTLSPMAKRNSWWQWQFELWVTSCRCLEGKLWKCETKICYYPPVFQFPVRYTLFILSWICELIVHPRINLLKPSPSVCTACFNMPKLSDLPLQCICVLNVDLTINWLFCNRKH
jgi:hypothetical protein